MGEGAVEGVVEDGVAGEDEDVEVGEDGGEGADEEGPPFEGAGEAGMGEGGAEGDVGNGVHVRGHLREPGGVQFRVGVPGRAGGAAGAT